MIYNNQQFKLFKGDIQFYGKLYSGIYNNDKIYLFNYEDKLVDSL